MAAYCSMLPSDRLLNCAVIIANNWQVRAPGGLRATDSIINHHRKMNYSEFP